MAKRPKEKKKEPTISIFDKSDEDDANDRGSTVLPPAPPPVAQGVASEIMLSRRRRSSGSSLETPSSSSNSPDSPRRGLGVGLGGTIVGDIEGFGDTVELKKVWRVCTTCAEIKILFLSFSLKLTRRLLVLHPIGHWRVALCRKVTKV